jgi:potassium-dependent mechanosensitive channel
MRMRQLIKVISLFILCAFTVVTQVSHAQVNTTGPTDRIQLVTEQINLLKSRLDQSSGELTELQKHNKDTNYTIDKINKNIFDKATLDLSVSTSNLDSINIELTDCQQTISWLDKGMQDSENQLNA